MKDSQRQAGAEFEISDAGFDKVEEYLANVWPDWPNSAISIRQLVNGISSIALADVRSCKESRLGNKSDREFASSPT